MTAKPKLRDKVWLVCRGKIIEGFIYRIDQSVGITDRHYTFEDYYLCYENTHHHSKAILNKDFFLSEEDCFKAKKDLLEQYLAGLTKEKEYFSKELEILTDLMKSYKENYDK